MKAESVFTDTAHSTILQYIANTPFAEIATPATDGSTLAATEVVLCDTAYEGQAGKGHLAGGLPMTRWLIAR